jgi:hypothetical protein
MSDEDSLVLAHELYLDAICGVGFPSITIGMDAEKRGLAYYSGDQNNPAWRWRRDKLGDFALTQLIDLYTTLKGAQ